jgi:hypothetical protein
VIGPSLYVMMECDESPPRKPELLLCQPCRDSLYRWLNKRQLRGSLGEPLKDREERREERQDEPDAPRRRRHRRRGTRSRDRFVKELDRRDARERRRLLVSSTVRPYVLLLLAGAVFAALFVFGVSQGLFVPE